jgi:hypothetical protein
LGVSAPKDTKFFAPPAHAAGTTPTATTDERRDERRVGLLEWADVSSATEALVVANNHKIGTQTLKLAFTSNSINSGGDKRGASTTAPAFSGTTI